MQESPGLKPYCFDGIMLLSIENLNISVNINFLRFFSHASSKETER